MEKILVVLNAHEPQLASIQFACRLAALAKTHLTGLFVENLFERKADEAKGSYFKSVAEKGAEAAVATDADLAITFFTRECALHAVVADTYLDRGEPIQLVLRESRFADLLVMDPGLNFYDDDDERLPSHFCKEILAGAECPVLLSPGNVTPIDEIVFCYDGSASSVFAMKQFACLLPELKGTPAVLLSANREEEKEEDNRRLLAWLRLHYKQLSFELLSGNDPDELFTYLFRKEKKLVVLGSYGRSALSNFFRHSAADRLIRTVDLPLFITHINR